MGLFMVWTTHKSKQAQAEQKQKTSSMRLDSLARRQGNARRQSRPGGGFGRNAGQPG